jgi:hypothetical protein
MNSDTQCLPRQQRRAWRVAGCPIILACRNRDLGTPAANHEARTRGVIEMATATPARRLPDALPRAYIAIYCHPSESLAAASAPDPKSDPQLRLVEAKGRSGTSISSRPRDSAASWRRHVKPLHCVAGTQRGSLKRDCAVSRQPEPSATHFPLLKLPRAATSLSGWPMLAFRNLRSSTPWLML